MPGQTATWKQRFSAPHSEHRYPSGYPAVLVHGVKPVQAPPSKQFKALFSVLKLVPQLEPLQPVQSLESKHGRAQVPLSRQRCPSGQGQMTG
jgi:hypothetical protein